MAQSGYTPILIYGSGTATNVPLAANLTSSASGAELALNYADGKLYFKNSSGVVTLLAGSGGGPAGGSNTQVQYNSSGSLAGSSSFIWDNTNGRLGIGIASPAYPLNVYQSIGITTASATQNALAVANSVSSTEFGTFASGIGYASANGANSFQIFTNANARITADSSGNVGIGTSSPQSSLQVSGAMPVSPTGNGIHMGITTSNTCMQFNAGSGNVSLIDFSTSGTDYLGRILYDNTSNSFQFSTNTTERMRIDSSGNVGIGTSSPSYPLDVNGQARTNGLRLGYQTALYNVDSTLSSYTSTNGVYLNGNAAGWANVAADGTLATQIRLYGSTNASANIITLQNSGSETMRLTASNNVGIGTGSPSSILHISQTTYPTLRIAGGANYGGILQFKGNDNVENAYLLSYGTGSGSQSNCIIFGTNTATNSGAIERMRINQYGNISLQGGTLTATGTGITFPATQSASSDPNCLDDYEVGTWTPTLVNGGTITTNTYSGVAAYTKIGRQVTITFGNCSISGVANNSTFVQISGLPFTANAQSAGGFGFFNNTSTLFQGFFTDGGILDLGARRGDYLIRNQDIYAQGSIFFTGTITYYV